MSDPTTFSLALANETATAHLMADLALLIGPGDVITLSGDLGAGKTAAARAMIRYLAGDETVEVPSSSATSAARHISTSRRISTERWRPGRYCRAAMRASRRS